MSLSLLYDKCTDQSVIDKDFLRSLSQASRGTVDEKLRWVFSLYDLNGDGYITKSEMMSVAAAIFDMLGRHTTPATIDNVSAKQRVDAIFNVNLNIFTILLLNHMFLCLCNLFVACSFLFLFLTIRSWLSEIEECWHWVVLCCDGRAELMEGVRMMRLFAIFLFYTCGYRAHRLQVGELLHSWPAYEFHHNCNFSSSFASAEHTPHNTYNPDRILFLFDFSNYN